MGDLGSIPGSGRSPEEGNGNPLQYLAWKIPWTEEPGGLEPIALSPQLCMCPAMSFPKVQELFSEKDGLHQQSPPLGTLEDKRFSDKIWHTLSLGWYAGLRVWPMQ